jgi:hypothetical protein
MMDVHFLFTCAATEFRDIPRCVGKRMEELRAVQAERCVDEIEES